jgi:hypothetical protein
MKLFVPPTLWYEDALGTFLEVSDTSGGAYDPPAGAHYQVAQFPTILRTSFVGPDGSEVFAGESSWWPALVLAMATVPWWKRVFGLKRYSIHEAILIVATSCERCMNALAHQYGLKDGYPEGGPAWRASNTRCHFCDPEMAAKAPR